MGRRRDRSRQHARAKVRVELRDAAIDAQTEELGFVRAKLAYVVGSWVAAAASGGVAYVFFGLSQEHARRSTEGYVFVTMAVVALLAFAWPLKMYADWRRGIGAREALEARVAPQDEVVLGLDDAHEREVSEVTEQRVAR